MVFPHKRYHLLISFRMKVATFSWWIDEKVSEAAVPHIKVSAEILPRVDNSILALAAENNRN